MSNRIVTEIQKFNAWTDKHPAKTVAIIGLEIAVLAIVLLIIRRQG